MSIYIEDIEKNKDKFCSLSSLSPSANKMLKNSMDLRYLVPGGHISRAYQCMHMNKYCGRFDNMSGKNKSKHLLFSKIRLH